MRYRKDGFSVFIGGLSHNTKPSDVKAWIQDFGLPEVNYVRVISDEATGLCRGFCFVFPKDETDGQNLIQMFNGAVFPDGRKLRAGVGKRNEVFPRETHG